MSPWLSKRFADPLLGTVSYVKCPHCGFVSAPTITELPAAAWSEVNANFHASYQGTSHDPNDPAWLPRMEAQVNAISELSAVGLLPRDRPWLDYGCGDGKLSQLVATRVGRELLGFEPYLPLPGYLKEDDLKARAFSLVITTSVFEHLRSRSQMDAINALVADNGVMGLHTLVAEEVPADPEWFYFLPVHCSFFSNASMQSLFEQWNYRASLYQPISRLWFWFKTDPETVEQAAEGLNRNKTRDQDRYHFKRGFMDYWRLKPADVMTRRWTSA